MDSKNQGKLGLVWGVGEGVRGILGKLSCILVYITLFSRYITLFPRYITLFPRYITLFYLNF